MKPFDAPEAALGGIGTDTVATLIAAASDIALILDGKGIIRDLAFGNEELSSEVAEDWIGRAWVETVTNDSRPRVEALIADAKSSAGTPAWQQVDHLSRDGAKMPVRYLATRLGDRDHLVAIGRNLQGIAALQQRLVDAQQSLERDYWRLRQLETRYRLLFRSATDAVVIIDPENSKVVEANPAATLLLITDSRRLVGRAFPDGFDESGTRAIQSLVAGIRATGRGNDVRAQLRTGTTFQVSGAPVRQENNSLILLRLSPLETESSARSSVEPRSRLSKMVEKVPDGVVLTANDGRILSANAAFLELATPAISGTCECVLELEDVAGGEMRVQLKSVEAPDLAALTRSFRETER